MRRALLIAGMALLVAWGTEASAALVTNGGFETGDFTGWTASAGVVIDGFQPNSGNFDAAFTAIPPAIGSLQQMIATPGTNYILSFALDNGSTDFLGSASFVASFDGVPLALATFDATKNFGLGYFVVTLPVSTSHALTQLSFVGSNVSGDWYLDDVSLAPAVTTVPEPPSVVVFGGMLAILFALSFTAVPGLRVTRNGLPNSR